MNFVCFSVNNWEKRMARKQQFMLALAQRADVTKVIYLEPPLNFLRLLFFPFSELKNKTARQRWLRALRAKPERLADKLFLVTPLFWLPFSYRWQVIYQFNWKIAARVLQKNLARLGIERYLLWLYHPYDFSLLDILPQRDFAVFDWAEEWSEYFKELSDNNRQLVRKLQESIIRKVDIVFTVSKKLLVKAQALNPCSYQIFDATAPQLFIGVNTVAGDIAKIKKPIAGYLGTITERFDVGLLADLADSFKDVSFVLIGALHQQRVDVLALKQRQNIYFFGEKDYQQLANYAVNFDLTILPYTQSQALGSPPTKIFDYLAIGKPIVSRYLIELEQFNQFLYLAKDNQEFKAMFAQALSENDPQLIARRQQLALANSWTQRAQEIMLLIKDKLL